MKLKWRDGLPRKLKRVVIKLGSQVVAEDVGLIRKKLLKKVCSEISQLIEAEVQVVLVTSGAISLGISKINGNRSSIDFDQAASAVGQVELMLFYKREFELLKLNCAQILLTHEDIKNRTRYLNIRSTLERLLNSGIIPILNENDCVSFDEITLGDNDQLAAMVAEVISADALLMITAPDGLYNRDPQAKDNVNPLEHYSRIGFNDDLSKVKAFSRSEQGKGGMKTKLLAATKLTPIGIHVIIASYMKKKPILRAFCDSTAGTIFEANEIGTSFKRKSWLWTLQKSNCVIKVDEGAYKALIEKNSSLLPSGIQFIKGKFKRGDCVAIMHKRKLIAVGLTEYDSNQIEKIIGRQGHEISSILNMHTRDVVIHRDNISKRINAHD